MSKQVEAHILKQYKLVRQMGSGAYGHVWQVQQTKTKKHFALKKVFDAFRNSVDAQRTYRQVQTLKQLNHENIVRLFKVMKSKNKKDLYMLFEFMEADLHSIVGSNILEKMHQVYVFYQMLKALRYLHSAELIHRDLKPSNVLLNSECKVKICDFGLVRTLNAERDEEAILSEEVATKWYRAPELLLGSRSYKKPIDIWSFGCIVAEILTGKPMFAGDSTLNQLQKIMEYTGSISAEDIESLDSPVAQQLITQIHVKKRSFRQYFSQVDPDFWVLLKGTLQFNPTKRMTISQVLDLEIFDEFREQIQKLKGHGKAIKLEIDDNIRFGMKVYRDKIYKDIEKSEAQLNGYKKFSESSNLIANYSKSQSAGGKRRVVSQQKYKGKENQKIKFRNFSVGSEIKGHKHSGSKQKKPSPSSKYLKNSPAYQFSHNKPNPYKNYFSSSKLNPAKSTSNQLLSNYYKKPFIESNKIKKISQPFRKKPKIQNSDKDQTNKKLIRKVSSAKDTKIFNKNHILKSIGFS